MSSFRLAFDPEVGKGHGLFVAGAKDPDQSGLRPHLASEVGKPVIIFTKTRAVVVTRKTFLMCTSGGHCSPQSERQKSQERLPAMPRIPRSAPLFRKADPPITEELSKGWPTAQHGVNALARS